MKLCTRNEDTETRQDDTDIGMAINLQLTATALAALVALVAVTYRDDFDPSEVQGKRVLVTEASTGIGEQMAYHFAKMGAILVLVDGREKALKKVQKECKKLSPNPSPNHVYVVTDMSKMADTERVVKFAEERLGGLDILVLTHALITICNPWLGTKANLSILATGMDIGFRSHVHLASHALPLLLKSRGRIAVVTSMAGAMNSPHMSVYTASKNALAGFFSVLHKDLMTKKSGVSVTLCSIGGSTTEIVLQLIRSLFYGHRQGELHLEDPRVVSMEIIQATMARKHEIYTSVDTWSLLVPGPRTDCTTQRSRPAGPACITYCSLPP
ncbi:hydroxysteroid 11-beta-dehydrogenase 1-like protein [Lingula anatina]|uniref:Hydroxysteroid 11-beta-dehydrogenase 1-like protein n=1 Tax=Lingula anatina TaxID=7574 RepID=A0A1S3JNR0_LINAN|nr:hydroxysteroid 11-beta-dehydrogenase 1-like protein [Lingula anatina]|eukprot:XP_013412010.1 hydroxysteroid 11-beta-dehydrogenase 1-like protein [Lingula anatina]